jgi:hypothetical protein
VVVRLEAERNTPVTVLVSEKTGLRVILAEVRRMLNLHHDTAPYQAACRKTGAVPRP